MISWRFFKRIWLANDDERAINITLWAWNVANGVILAYLIWYCWISKLFSWSWHIHKQRLEFDDIVEDDEQMSEEDSWEDVEQLEEEGVIRDNNDVVERVVRRVWEGLFDSESFEIT